MLRGCDGPQGDVPGSLQGGGSRPVPLLMKHAPDLAEAELKDAVGAIVGAGVDGILATNTTLARAGLPPPGRQKPGA